MAMVSLVSLLGIAVMTSTVTSAEHAEIARLCDNVYVEATTLEGVDGGSSDGTVILYAGEESTCFKVEEFTKYDNNPSARTVSKISTVHIPELVKLRSAVGEPIIIRSGARSYEHEKKMGRSGASQHVYDNGEGAVDISLDDFSKKKLDRLEYYIFKVTDYTRIARYGTFIHLDFASNRYGERAYYKNTDFGWLFVGEVINE